MGADLITVALATKRDTTPDWSAARDFIDDKTKVEDFPDEGFHWIEDLEEIKNAYKGALGDLEYAMQHGARSLTAYPVRDLDFIIIGGTSWGDSPSDIFDQANAIACWPELLATAGFVDWWEPE